MVHRLLEFTAGGVVSTVKVNVKGVAINARIIVRMVVEKTVQKDAHLQLLLVQVVALLVQVLHLQYSVLHHLVMEHVGVLVIMHVIHLAQKIVLVTVTPRV